MLLLPGSPEFELIRAAVLPPGWQQLGARTFIVRADGSGLLEPATEEEVIEYVEGGEYDQRLIELGEFEDADDW